MTHKSNLYIIKKPISVFRASSTCKHHFVFISEENPGANLFLTKKLKPMRDCTWNFSSLLLDAEPHEIIEKLTPISFASEFLFIKTNVSYIEAFNNLQYVYILPEKVEEYITTNAIENIAISE